MDVFEEKILCSKCDELMKLEVVNKHGFQVRALKCLSCNKQILHPTDLNNLQDYKNLKGKTYDVKLRVVGNSHAISIPKEIVNFIKHQEKVFNDFDDMVRLCFDDFDKMTLRFNNRKGGIF